MTAIRDFRIDIPEAELDDLHRRLEQTRFREARWRLGVDRAFPAPFIALALVLETRKHDDRQLTLFPDL